MIYSSAKDEHGQKKTGNFRERKIEDYKYVKKILFLYSHKTQLNIKLSLLQHYNMFRPKLAAIFRLYMKPI